MEITGRHTANWMCDLLCTSATLQTDFPKFNSLVPRDFHYLASFPAKTKLSPAIRHLTLTVSVSGYNNLGQM